MNKFKSAVKKIIIGNTVLLRLYKKYVDTKLKAYISKKNKSFNKNGMQVLKTFCTLLNNAHIPFWLCYGTLLGYIRENGLLKHDFDFDFGMWRTDYNKDFEDLLVNAGFTLVHQYKTINTEYDAFEQTYEKDGVSIDIFYHYKNEEKTWTHVFYREPEDIDLNSKGLYRIRKLDYPTAPLQLISFLGNNVYMPSNPEIYLGEIYGKNWQIPDPNYDWHNGPKNNCTIKDIYGIME